MQTELHSLSRVFTETLYRIPDYQRGYAWGERQIRDFWSDLEQLQPAGNHYTGVLTLEEVRLEEYSSWEDDRWIIEAKHFSPYYVVDGQQRLSTIIILLQCLIAAIGNNRQVNYTSVDEIRKKFIFESKDGGISRSFLFGYEKDNPSYEFLKTVILEERSDSYSPSEETIYTHNLLAAKEFFRGKLAGLALPELEHLYTKVTQHLLFNVYVITREIDVFVAFETMNNRGKRLSHLELLKNRLIFLSTKFDVDAEERGRLRRTINESWKTVYHYLGKNKNRPLDDDLFLSMYQWLTFPPDSEEEEKPLYRRRYWSPRNEEQQDYLLDAVFTLRNMPDSEKKRPKYELSVDYLYNHSHEIKEAVRLYYDIWNPQESRFTDQEKIWLEKLCRIAGDREVLLIFAAYKVASEPTTQVRFLKVLERVLFLQSIHSYTFRLEDFSFSSLAVKLAKREMSVPDLIKELTKCIEGRLTKADIGAAIREWVKRSYRTKGLPYFMFEYEQELREHSKTYRDKQLSWDEFAKEKYDKDYTTIEHIYPQKVTAQCWKTPFAHFDIRQRNVLRNSIGNLVPLSRPKNASLSNRSFEEKKGREGTSIGYIYGCYTENEVAQNAKWSVDEIIDRSVRLLEFIERRWELSFGDTDKKIELLGLDFALCNQHKIPLDEPTDVDSEDS